MAAERNTFDIVVRMLAEGDGAKVTAAQIKELQKQQEALNKNQNRSSGEDRQLQNIKAVTEALKNQKPATEALPPVIKEVVASTDKATTSKKQLNEALKGLSIQFPALTQVIRAAVSPIGLTAAAASIATSAIAQEIMRVDELLSRARRFATFGDEFDPVRTLRENMKGASADIVRDLKAIERAADTVVSRLSEMNDELSDARRREDQIDDETTRRDIQAVRTGVAGNTMTKAQGDAAIERIEAAARDRKEQRDIETKRQRSANFSNAAFQSRNEGVEADRELEALKPQLAAQRRTARKAAENQRKIEEDADVETAAIDKKLGILQEFGSGSAQPKFKEIGKALLSGGLVGSLDIGDPLAISKAVAQVFGGDTKNFGGIGDPAVAGQRIAELQARKGQIFSERDNAGALAEQETNAVKDIEARRDDAIRKRNDSRRNQIDFNKQAQREFDSANQDSRAVKEAGAIRSETQALKTQERAAEEAKQRKNELERQATEASQRGEPLPVGHKFQIDHGTGKATLIDQGVQHIIAIDANIGKLVPALEKLHVTSNTIDSFIRNNRQRA